MASRNMNNEYAIKYNEAISGLKFLFTKTVCETGIKNDQIKEYFNHGVARRLKIIERSVVRIFELMPPDSEDLLDDDDLIDVQIYLHSFIINLYGIFENWSIIFVLQHGIEQEIGKMDRTFFRNVIKQYLPTPLKNEVSSSVFNNWQNRYLSNFRHALAHRIPLYIPPSTLNDEDILKMKKLDVEWFRAITNLDHIKADKIQDEKAQIGTVCKCFIHSYEESSKLILIHPQILSDSLLVIKFGNLFLENYCDYEF